jgi:hypothetical protein
MAVIDDRTPGIDLPLPHQDNPLEDDVLRLRAALTAIDAVLSSDEPLLASVQAIVDALGANASTLATHGTHLEAVDTALAAIDVLLASDDPDFDTLQEIVDALKDNIGLLFDHTGSGGSAHAVATDSVAGFMSASDKSKLDSAALGIAFDSVLIVPTADAQTAFTVTGGYAPGSIMVFLNGVKLLASAYTATTSPDLVIAAGADMVDTIEVVRFRLALRQAAI